jgi:hypothetical protein
LAKEPSGAFMNELVFGKNVELRPHAVEWC